MPNAQKQPYNFARLLFCASTTLLLLVFFPLWKATAAPLVLTNASHYPLAGHLQLLVDKGSTLELKDILTPANRAAFQPVPGYINQGYTTAAVWITFSLLRTEPFSDEVYLHFWPPYLDFADVYVQTAADPLDPAAYALIRLGDHIPVALRPIKHPEFIAPFVIPENVVRSVYVRLRSSSTINFYAAIHDNRDMISHGTLNIVLQSGYLAIAIIVAVINMIYFVRLRDRLYLYFSLYLFAIFINHTAVTGILTIVWPDMANLLSDYLVGVGIGLLLIFFALFGMQLFNTRKSPWLHRFFILTIVLGSSTFFSVPFGWYNRSAPLLIIWSTLIIFLLTGLSCRRTFRGEAGGKLYLIAFGASNIGYGIQFLRVLGPLPVAWWNMYSMQIGTLINMVFMTLALTDRIYRNEQKTLLTARESEQRAVSLAEDMTRDIRDKQAKLAAALQSEKDAMLRKERFISMLNHEYRTPLAIIQTNISILELRIGLNSLLTPLFVKIRKAMERLVEVLETSLEREKILDTIGGNRPSPIVIEPFFNELLQEIGNLWSERQLQVEITGMTDRTVQGDSLLLKTACLNIIANAFNYSSPEQPVTLTARAVDNELTISVTDHGCGIPPEQLDHVFEINYRGAQEGKSSGKGVGLYLVKSVISQFGGTVNLESATGSGTVVTVTLPLANNPGTV